MRIFKLTRYMVPAWQEFHRLNQHRSLRGSARGLFDTRLAQVKADPLPPMPVVKLADSRPQGLSLSQVLDAVAATYPVLVAARTEARAAAQDVQATERLRWPSVSANSADRVLVLRRGSSIGVNHG